MRLRVTTPAAPLRKQVVDRLRKAITECMFEPGGRLIERQLCELLGVSRSSVREALRQLESEGLIRLIANKGPAVAMLTPDEARQIYEVRAVLESLAVRLFTELASDAELARLERSVEQMAESCEGGDWLARHKAKARFYEILGQGCGNDVVRTQLEQLRARVTLVRRQVLSQDQRADESLAEIRTIVAAIRLRDAAAAAAACVAHIGCSARYAMAMLNAPGMEAASEPRRRRRGEPARSSNAA